MKRIFLLYFSLFFSFYQKNVTGDINLEKVVEGFKDPVAYIEDPLPGGSRKFVVEKGGKIHIVKNDQIEQTPFLDFSDIVSTNANEGGLLGLAFHPKYKKNGYFFIYYTIKTSGGIRSILRRIKVSKDNPDVADVKKEKKEVFWSLDQDFQNHNGGHILFGPDDGFLYVFLGDGGSGGDPKDRAQDLTSELGKILRIKTKTKKNKATYGIPKDNPFKKNKDGIPQEIFHYGVRNPWRNSFDRDTGDLFIGDVGQNKIEEISIAEKGEIGLNFGWRLLEGDECFDPKKGCRDNAGPLRDPILTYDHNQGDCSVTGGYVYRGSVLNDLVGKYLYSDFCTGTIRVGTNNGNGQWTEETLLETNLMVSSFGEDNDGELYVVDYIGGAIYKIVPAGMAT